MFLLFSCSIVLFSQIRLGALDKDYSSLLFYALVQPFALVQPLPRGLFSRPRANAHEKAGAPLPEKKKECCSIVVIVSLFVY